MIFNLYSYFSHRHSSKPIRLALLMVVKDEIDIIKASISYHSQVGVEGFFIVDNGSTDGTKELLVELSKQYFIKIFHHQQKSFIQDTQMTFLSHQARKHGFDFALQSDADEFWCVVNEDGNLSDFLSREDTVIKVNRENILPEYEKKEQENYWFKSQYITKTPINYRLSKTDVRDPCLINPSLGGVLEKVVTNLHGLKAVSGGNHGARHYYDKIMRRKYCRWSNNIVNFHYALRSFKTFKKKAENINVSIKYGRMLQKGAIALYYNKAYEMGKLEQVYDAMHLKKEQIQILEELDLIQRTEEIKNLNDKIINLLA